jgi:plasmid stabilization system protein ParE
MIIKITDPAKDTLRKIYQYYRSKGAGMKGRKIRMLVLEQTKFLLDSPYLGQEEEFLKHKNQGHRYLLIESTYKVIYRVVDEIIYVTDVFDTRQNPDKMKS